jgi:hypothetical protein
MDDTATGKTTTKSKPDTTQGDAEAQPAVTAYEVAPGRMVGGKGPGEKVDLTDDDALRLYELGFILDEDGNRAGFSDGPKTASGIEIKEI